MIPSRTLFMLILAVALGAFPALAQEPQPSADAEPPDLDHVPGLEHPHGGLAEDADVAPDAKEAPFDLQFLDSMIHHHAEALKGAQRAESQAQHAELREMAARSAEQQKKDIEKMQGWRKAWYPDAPLALNMDLAGKEKARRHMHEKDMPKAEGMEFDLHFIEMMIPHHEGAIAMSRAALEEAEHAELKEFAQKTIESQQKEIEEMKRTMKGHNH